MFLRYSRALVFCFLFFSKKELVFLITVSYKTYCVYTWAGSHLGQNDNWAKDIWAKDIWARMDIWARDIWAHGHLGQNDIWAIDIWAKMKHVSD